MLNMHKDTTCVKNNAEFYFKNNFYLLNLFL